MHSPVSNVNKTKTSKSNITPSMESENKICEEDFTDKLYIFRRDHPKNFIFAHINVNHFRNKFIEVAPWLNEGIMDMLAVAETKLDDSFPSKQFKVENYTLYRSDRNCNGGGILCYIRSCIPHRERPDLCYRDNGIESMIIEVNVRKEIWFFIIVYRPPQINTSYLCLALEQMSEKCQFLGKSVFVMGDLNVNVLKNRHALADFLDTYCMQNVVKGPTCFKNPDNPTLVDVILTDSWSRVHKCINVGNGISDFHNLICAASKMHVPQTCPRKICYRSYKHFCDTKFVEALTLAPFHVSEVFDNIDDKMWYHNKLLTDVVNVHAPMKKKVIKGNQLPYMNGELRKEINVKNMLRRKFNRYPTAVNWENFRQKRNKVTSLKSQAVKKYFSERCKNQNNSKKFWNTVKPFMTNKAKGSDSSISLLVNNKIISDKVTICNVFNDYFVNVTNDLAENGNVDMSGDLDDIFKVYKDHPSVKSIREQTSLVQPFDFKHVNVNDVKKILKSTKTKKAPGYDNVPPKLIKLGAEILSHTLTPIFNECITSKVYPTDLKCAEVAPVYKKGDNLNKSNFRPVSVLTCISKVFESLMSSQMEKGMSSLLSHILSAYRKGHSCEHVLIKASN